MERKKSISLDNMDVKSNKHINVQQKIQFFGNLSSDGLQTKSEKEVAVKQKVKFFTNIQTVYTQSASNINDERYRSNSSISLHEEGTIETEKFKKISSNPGKDKLNNNLDKTGKEMVATESTEIRIFPTSQNQDLISIDESDNGPNSKRISLLSQASTISRVSELWVLLLIFYVKIV